MNDAARVRERALWIALVAVLATSLVWLATVAVFALVGFHGPALAPVFAVARVIGRVALALVPRLLPLLSVALLGAMMLWLGIRGRSAPHRRTRHV